MATIDFILEDQDARFQLDLPETPRMGEFVKRGGRTFVAPEHRFVEGARSALALGATGVTRVP